MVTILQAPLLTDFLYPLLLVFFVTFAILEKTNIFGEGKKQLNAAVSLVISLIFVGAVFPKIIVANLVQFMSVGLVVIFVGLLLWGFVSGEGKFPQKMTGAMGWIIGIAVFFAVLWATGVGSPIVVALQKLVRFLFDSNWSGSFWTNFIFVLVVAVAIAAVLWVPGKKN
jgi:hypothetical protein